MGGGNSIDYQHDINIIKNTEYLFARKFDKTKYPEIVEYVIHLLSCEKD